MGFMTDILVIASWDDYRSFVVEKMFRAVANDARHTNSYCRPY